MKLKTKSLESYSMKATDGELGKIDDFYFSPNSFEIKYVVGDTRTWFFGGKVLLHPESFKEINIIENYISVNATKEQIKNSPKPGEHGPTIGFERELNHYYGWSYFAGATNTYTARQPALGAVFLSRLNDTTKENKSELEKDQETNLVSIDDIRGFEVHAKNGIVGKVSDFIVDQNNWFMPYLEIDVGGYFDFSHVLVPTESIKEVNTLDKTLSVTIEKEMIEKAPRSEPAISFNEIEPSLEDYYKGITR
ncbi:PRC-barrel domain-containing protein [Bacillus solitudinis]|uniref:PRC-barrel domain-containing protein n=1 Tax=Bacillus solitudinis TaxID=2014074 RepID=UPI000C239251|nr:PRC-barrel domain-containing protein [Bacillus solitudinis]